MEIQTLRPAYFDRTYFDHIKRKWKSVVLYGIISMLFIAGISLFLPLEYRAYTQVFILPKNILEIDSYTSVKSAERIGENLTRLMETSSFLDLVLFSGQNKIDITSFPRDPKSQLKFWKRAIKSEVVPGTGLIKISVYSKSKEQGRIILQSTANVLTSRGTNYTGVDVEIKQVDSIFVSDFPVRPNILANAVLGFILGVSLGGLHMVIEGERAWKL